MAEKVGAKQVEMTVTRVSRADSKLVQATGFKLRLDKSRGIVDVQLEQRGLKAERVSFDPLIIKSNLRAFKEYAAGLTCESDETAMKDEIGPLTEADTYSNVIHLCQTVGRAETVFGLFRWADWVEASRPQKGASTREVESWDALVIISTNGFQKKLVLELLSVLDEDTLL
jgi:hypothetical protein